ncbi:predicted protein [Phaeodactylum tricornutum CCAP 1055/1]|jgi:phosphatidylglycerophosphate synthase|uniref:Uncharacterized protein n=1 Tax=Phaeodactylum tricornutum (strain CCAP 1055/1) TaxID=556484 RepID=B7FQZ6_PHATC|nr:predicted protein [Phaeodactylum tricornutum CCAP 1055/1]EEC51956.1 predicted protein [Phaeodactylum tricornutum CCAP 1055/1]|eukprot:XP_002177493.1 predicted protein [Phaeodactylum tricornutum CCAP 1055/1]
MSSKNLLTTVGELIDAIVELYLKTVIAPFLHFHEIFYSSLNRALRQLLDDHKHHIPDWFTANLITYVRTVVVVPTLVLLSWNHAVLPALLVLAVDFGDFLDGVVARYWVDVKKERAETAAASDKDKKNDPALRTPSPTNSDDESFEVVTTGSPHAVPSWVRLHRNRTYGGFVDAVCDKAFVVPCWISLLHVIPHTSYLQLVQYLTLIALVLAETASGCVRFKAYFTATGVPAPKVEGFDFSTSAVKADHIGKAKQTFEMVGTALFLLPLTRYVGLVLLLLALPLAYESVRRKVKTRAIYVQYDSSALDHKTIKFWMQAKAMGSSLTVGVPGEAKQTDQVLNACAVAAVDQVLVEAPSTVDWHFLRANAIDFCVVGPAQTKYVTDKVLESLCALQIGEDGVARPIKVKTEHKD